MTDGGTCWRAAILVAGLTGPLGLAGCAGRPAMRAAIPAGTALTGVIVSIRPVARPVAGAETGVLDALGAPSGAGAPFAPATEVIVREPDGSIVSILQRDPASLHEGERVRILQGVETRLVPLGVAA